MSYMTEFLGVAIDQNEIAMSLIATKVPLKVLKRFIRFLVETQDLSLCYKKDTKATDASVVLFYRLLVEKREITQRHIRIFSSAQSKRRDVSHQTKLQDIIEHH